MLNRNPAGGKNLGVARLIAFTDKYGASVRMSSRSSGRALRLDFLDFNSSRYLEFEEELGKVGVEVVALDFQ